MIAARTPALAAYHVMGTALGSPPSWQTQHRIEYAHGLDPNGDEQERRQFFEAEANACLVAAAPDLLRNLTFAAEAFERMRAGQYVPRRAVMFHEAAAEFRKTIAKATGDPS